MLRFFYILINMIVELRFDPDENINLLLSLDNISDTKNTKEERNLKRRPDNMSILSIIRELTSDKRV